MKESWWRWDISNSLIVEINGIRKTKNSLKQQNFEISNGLIHQIFENGYRWSGDWKFERKIRIWYEQAYIRIKKVGDMK